MWVKVRKKLPCLFGKKKDTPVEMEETYQDHLQDINPVYAEPKTKVWSANRDHKYLYPFVSQLFESLEEECNDNGLGIYLFEGRRSFNRQSYLYDQGRKRKTGHGETLRKVTNAQAGLSFHQYGLAGDFVFKSNGQWSWNGDYQKFGEIVSAFPALEWAGRWDRRFREYPHVQLKTSFTIVQLYSYYEKYGSGEAGIRAVWDLLSGVGA